MENAISQYIEKNKSDFSTQESIDKLRSSILLISGSLPIQDRVAMAGKIVASEKLSAETQLLKALASSQVSPTWNGTDGVGQADNKNKKDIDALASFL